MNHIVDTCPLTKFEGELNRLHEANDDAVTWLESRATAAALAKQRAEYVTRRALRGQAGWAKQSTASLYLAPFPRHYHTYLTACA